jgi:hypothetical protein
MLPSARCDCGQPWEAHELRCPRPKRKGVGSVIALAVAAGLILQVLFVALAVVVARLTRPSTNLGFHPLRIAIATAGPVQPRMRACELFYAWKKTHKPSLLNEAVADAHSSHPRQFAPRFRTDMTGLRNSVREGAHSRRPSASSTPSSTTASCSRVALRVTGPKSEAPLPGSPGLAMRRDGQRVSFRNRARAGTLRP